ncbi:hypothetical protein BLNAU_1678 [Blattamonas nauphoetae]|uniref:Balbiani ring protein 3-like n=1 Tax=Blattamonas nauphoetae TaxID=2049346 RepID=A0ABQ9YHA8_9EUKA|nr:hypothetical protein BLNAU_1678 [Blattamonas nauphoetae]
MRCSTISFLIFLFVNVHPQTIMLQDPSGLCDFSSELLLSRGQKRDRSLQSCTSKCMDNNEICLDECQSQYEACVLLPNGDKAICSKSLRNCRRPCQQIKKDCEMLCLQSFVQQCEVDCSFYVQNTIDECDFNLEECRLTCLIGDLTCERKCTVERRYCETNSRECGDVCLSNCKQNLPTCADNCLNDMESGFEVCEVEREECLNFCERKSRDRTALILCQSQCDDARLACKAEFRTSFTECQQLCDTDTEEDCMQVCEKEKQTCLTDSSDALDICRYSSLTSKASSTECNRLWRERNENCRLQFDTCLSIKCQPTAGNCRDDCLAFTDDCYSSAEIQLQRCVNNCRSNQQCQSSCKNDYRAMKESCRTAFTNCAAECEMGSVDVCVMDCEAQKQVGLNACDAELDRCNQRSSSNTQQIACLRSRRVCEASVRDLEESCTKSCDGSLDKDLETCKVNQQRMLDVCLQSYNDCDQKCSASANTKCQGVCLQARRDCQTRTTDELTLCEQSAKLKWGDRCSEDCSSQRQKCLDANETWFDTCFNEKCRGDSACQRQCRQKRRTNSHTCTTEYEICNNDCAFA